MWKEMEKRDTHSGLSAIFYIVLRLLSSVLCLSLGIGYSAVTYFTFLVYMTTIFNQKRRYLRAKIKFFKYFLTALPASSYENNESRIEVFFRIKRAGSSNYRGSVFLLPEFTPSVCLLAFLSGATFSPQPGTVPGPAGPNQAPPATMSCFES